MAEERLQITVDEKGALVVKRKLEGVGTSARKAGSGVKLLRTALGGLATIGIGAVLTSAVKTMASFSQEMSTVAAITKATTTQMEDMTDIARELGATTRFSATQAAQGMTFLARAGFNTNQVMASIGPTLQLAQAGALDLGRAADIASNVLTGFRLSANEAQRAIDVLANAANSANTDVNQLGEALSFVAPVAASLKVPLEETSAAVQSLSDAGIQASRAGTNLTTVMRLMSAITPKQAAVLADLGLTTEDVSISNVGLTKALKNLKDAGIGTTQTFQFFGRSAAAAGVLLESTEGKIQRFTKANEEAAGTAKRVADIMDNNLNGALLAVRSAWEELQLSFGDQGPQSALTQGLKSLATVLRTLAGNMDLASTAALALAASIAAVKYASFLQGISSAAGAMGLLTKGIVAVRAALTGLALNPITVGIVVLSAAVVTLNAAFAKLNKLNEEAAAIEIAGLKAAIARRQEIVKGINDRKNATKALEAYITGLENENKFALLSIGVQQEQTVTFRALDIAKRELTDTEKKRLAAALKEKDAIANQNEVLKQEEVLLQSIKGPQQEFALQSKLLASLHTKGKITLEEKTAALQELQDKYGQMGAGGFDTYLANLAAETELLKLNASEQEIRRAQADAAAQKGSKLTGDQAATVATRIKERQTLATTAYIDQLAAENKLLAVNTEQQGLRAALAQAELRNGAELSAQQKEKITLLVAEREAITAANAEQQAKAELLTSIKGPQQEHEDTMRRLNELLVAGTINEQEFQAALANLPSKLTVVADASSATGEIMDSMWSNATSTLDNFIDGGVVSFRGFTSSILADISKILAKMLLLKAIKGIGGAFEIGGLATGGSFMVGGSGGTDSQLVAFKASPTERVDVLTPAQQQQQQAQGSAPPAVGAPTQVTVINLINPDDIPAAMASAAGTDVILNTVSINKQSFKAALA